MLKANEIEYIRRRPVDRFQTELAFAMARRFVRQQMRQKNLIIRDIVGASHFAALHSGAVITCNHFNAFDSFAIHLAYDASGQKERRLYRVIREGNYTSFPGFYGYLMRHCDTLPLSSSPKTMAKFICAVNTLLQEGHFVLFYPEQSMWWNYRKPKPLKDGAFNFAARNHVPILPCFITMQDSQTQGQDGFPVQEYTIHIGAPLWPDPGKNDRENTILLRERNAAVWRRLYEQEYDMPLVYRTAAPATGEA